MRRAFPAAAALVLSLAGCASGAPRRRPLRPVYYPGERTRLPATSALSLVPAIPAAILGTALFLPAWPFAGEKPAFRGAAFVATTLLTPVYLPFWIVGNSLDALPALARALPDIPSAPAASAAPARSPDRDGR